MRGGDAKTGLKTTDFALVIKSGNRHKYVQNSVRFLREHNRKKGITNKIAIIVTLLLLRSMHKIL